KLASSVHARRFSRASPSDIPDNSSCAQLMIATSIPSTTRMGGLSRQARTYGEWDAFSNVSSNAARNDKVRVVREPHAQRHYEERHPFSVIAKKLELSAVGGSPRKY